MVLHLLLIKGGMKTENGKVNQRSTPEGAEVKTENYPPPPPLRGTLSEPDVKLGSLTFIRHKMTLSHFSKGLIHPVSGGQLAGMRGERMSGERAKKVKGGEVKC